jgi:hypothetical protein
MEFFLSEMIRKYLNKKGGHMFCSLKFLAVGSSLFALFFLPASFNMASARGIDFRGNGGGVDARSSDVGGQGGYYGHDDSIGGQGAYYGHDGWNGVQDGYYSHDGNYAHDSLYNQNQGYGGGYHSGNGYYGYNPDYPAYSNSYPGGYYYNNNSPSPYGQYNNEINGMGIGGGVYPNAR